MGVGWRRNINRLKLIWRRLQGKPNTKKHVGNDPIDWLKQKTGAGGVDLTSNQSRLFAFSICTPEARSMKDAAVLAVAAFIASSAITTSMSSHRRCRAPHLQEARPC